MVKSNRDELQVQELIEETKGEFCIFFACLLSPRHNFELSAPWSRSRTPCRSSDYIRDALQNSKYCRGHWGGGTTLPVEFYHVSHEFYFFPSEGHL